MLIGQWLAWWETIQELEATERLAAYTTALLADSGWKMERDAILEDWRQMAAGKNVQVVAQQSMDDPDAYEKFITHVYTVRNWLAMQFGRGEIE
jgi:hypothetical protein